MPSLVRYGWLSVLAALLTIALKSWAYLVTGSVGLLSDAAESLVNLLAAIVALATLGFAAQPADAGHPFGHGKAEYFASGFEGVLILAAAGGIAGAAWARLQHPQPLVELSLGMGISAGAGLVNLAVGLVLLRAGRRHGSITLEADGRHLLSDVWTTAAVLLGLGAIAVTGWLLLDPIIAFLAALQIVWSGFGLVARSASGLLDAALPAKERAAIESVFDRYREDGVGFHDLRTRAAGRQRLVTAHVVVPGHYSVQEGHDLLERIEGDIRHAIGDATIITHLEPLEDEASFAHDRLDSEDFGKTEPGNPDAIFGASRSSTRVPGRWFRLAGLLLLVGGGAASMILADPYADIAMGASLIGLILGLVGTRQARRSAVN